MRWIVWGVLLVTGFVVAIGFMFLLTNNIRLGGGARPFVIVGTIMFVCFEVIALPLILSKFLQTKKVQRYVTFKRASDGGPQFTLHSSFKDDDLPFEDFVAELMTAIQRQHTSAAPPDYTFKP